MSRRRHGAAACLGTVVLVVAAAPVAGQKDYYNLDRDRPVRIEDAYGTERYALEVKVAPLRLERERGGVYHWSFDPEIAVGILPRTSIEIGLPVAIIDGGEAGRSAGISGVELTAFHNLNAETRTLPALGIRGDVLLPVGSLSAERAYASITGIATRSYRGARVHVNGAYTFGAAPSADADEAVPHGASRWLAGAAIDRAFPLDSWLLIADLYAQRPLHAADGVEWHSGAGIRYQLSPFLALDAGVGRRLSGDPTWYFTFGSAYHVGVRALMPRVR